MPPKRKPEAEAPPNEYQFLDVDELPREIEELKKEFETADFKISVMVKTDHDTEFKKIPQTFSAEGFDANLIAQKFGGGIYKFTVRNSDGEFVKKWTTNFATERVNSSAGANMPNIINQVKDESTGKMIDLLTKQIDSAKAESKDNMNVILTTIMKMFEVVNRPTPPPPPPPTPANPLDDLLKLKTLLDVGSPKTDTGSDKLKEFMEMFRVAKDMVGDNNASPNDKLMDKGIDILTSLLQKKLESRPAMKPANTYIPPKPVKIDAVPEIQPVEQQNPPAVAEQPEDKVYTYIRKNLSTFINFAKRDTPVQSLSDYMYNSLGEQDFEGVQRYVETHGVDGIISQFPEMSLYRVWVSALIDDIKNYFEPADSETETEVEAGGEAENAPEKPVEQPATEQNSGN